MRRRGRPVLRAAAGLVAAALALVVAVVAVLHTGAGPRAGDRPGRAVLGASTAAAVEACAEVLLVGVEGGGEPRRRGATLSATPEVFRRAYAARAARDGHAGRTVRTVRVRAGGRPPSALLTSTRLRDVRAGLSVARARAWRAPVARAAARVVRAVDDAALDCPEQQVVLVGHAQGAAAAHRALVELARRPGVGARLVGAALVSDPERRSRSAAGAPVGAPAAARSGRGVLTRLLPAVADVPRPTPTYRAWNVCSTGDVVCDPRRTSARTALAAARGYHRGAGAEAVRAVARRLWDLTALRPVPAPEVRVVRAVEGEPFRVALAVAAAPSAAPAVRWSEARQLPEGVTLGADGVLQGTVGTAGRWHVTYVVRGTRPATPGATGVVVLTVPADAVSVTAGGQVSCETREDASAWCWGRGSHGQLGDGAATARSAPVQVRGPAGWAQLSTSGATTCGVRTDGTLWCWGLDDVGQLGIGRGAARAVPVQVGTATTWAEVSAGWFHTCGLRTTGALYCWGQGRSGQVGDGTRKTRGRPTRVGKATDWTSVTTGIAHTCGTRADGSAWCWGQNALHQLGAGTADQPAPVQVAGSGWLRLDAGSAHTCGLTAAGAAYCWGANDQGQLGDGTRTTRSAPRRVPGSHTWTTITTGDATTCGVDSSGAAWCWGANRHGQVGDGGSQPVVQPTPVLGGDRWLTLDAGWFHACGGLQTGPTSCWGNNEVGQVGDGTLTDRPQPGEVG